MTAERSFSYRALRPDGAEERGVLHASSESEAAANLARRRLYPTELRARDQRRGRAGRVQAADLALGFRTLAALLSSGLPLARALAAFDDIAPTAWRAALPGIRDAVSRGKSLATALDESLLGVPALAIGVLRAGEAGAGVVPALYRIAEILEEAAELRSGVIGALIYPAVLMGAGTLSIAVLVGLVLPRFSGILTDMGQALPPLTRIVIATSDGIRHAAPAAGILIVVALLAGRAAIATDSGRAKWHTLLLGLPVIGTVRAAMASARVAQSLSALLSSGVRVAPALEYAASAAGDAAVAHRVRTARKAIVAGRGLAASFEGHEVMTGTATRLLRAGEQAGRLPEMLDHAAKLESARAMNMVRLTVRLLEPGLILVLSCVIALVAGALLQAVYSVRPQ